jgi:hypothetical protein
MGEVLQVAAGLGTLAWYGSALYVGGRLLRLGLRTDNPPARWIGVYLFVAMGMGSVLMSIPMARGAYGGVEMTGLDRILIGLGCTATAIGNAGILTFTRRVFRSESRAAKAFSVAVVAILVCGAVGHGLTTRFDWRLTSGFAVLYLSGTILANGWASAESLLYHGAMRRRLNVGLAEPLDVNRFLLWGGGAGATTIILLSTTLEMQVQRFLSAAGTETLRLLTLPTMSVLGLVCAGCYLFAFFPAEWYVRRLSAVPARTSAA